jgi:hypothetical protein
MGGTKQSQICLLILGCEIQIILPLFHDSMGSVWQTSMRTGPHHLGSSMDCVCSLGEANFSKYTEGVDCSLKPMKVFHVPKESTNN